MENQKILSIGIVGPTFEGLYGPMTLKNKEKYANILKVVYHTLLNRIIRAEQEGYYAVEVKLSLRPGITMEAAKGILYMIENDQDYQKTNIMLYLTAFVPRKGYDIKGAMAGDYNFLEEVFDTRKLKARKNPEEEVIDHCKEVIMVYNSTSEVPFTLLQKENPSIKLIGINTDKAIEEGKGLRIPEMIPQDND